MIYLDTSVALAYLLAEDQQPPAGLWREDLVSSRLLQYELWTRLNARGLTESHREAALELIARLSFLELVPPVLERALEPSPFPVRTLDALHLASASFLESQLSMDTKSHGLRFFLSLAPSTILYLADPMTDVGLRNSGGPSSRSI